MALNAFSAANEPFKMSGFHNTLVARLRVQDNDLLIATNSLTKACVVNITFHDLTSQLQLTQLQLTYRTMQIEYKSEHTL